MKKNGNHMLGSMIRADFTSWLHTNRVIVSFCGIIIYCMMQASLPDVNIVNGITIHLTIAERVYTEMVHGFNKMGSLLFLLMISEIPRRTSFHYYTSIRSGRTKWLASQLIYIALIAAFVLIIMTLLYAAMIAPATPGSPGYTDDKMIEQGAYEEYDAIIRKDTREAFSPIGAILWAAVPVFLFWCIMAYSIFLLSLLGHPLIGPSFFGFILMSQTNVLWEAAPEWFHVPIEYANVAAIRTHSEIQTIQEVNKVFFILAAVVGALVVLMIAVVRKMDYTTISKAG